MQKRLVGIDIDGTLLRGSTEPQPDDKRAIERAVRQGVPVILATGRSHFSSQPLAAELCPGMPHVAYNGATIVAADGHFTRDFRVPLEAARYVLTRCRDIGLAVRVFLPDAVVMSEIPGPDEAFFKYRAFERVETDIADKLSEPPIQLVCLHPEDIEVFRREFSGTRIERDLHWMESGRDPEAPYEWALHILHKEGTKSAALAQLCEEWNIDTADTLVFGDGVNDVDMLAWAGTGVSFPWGVPEAQAAADIITDLDDPHPIKTVLERWLAGEPPISDRVA